MNIKQAFGIWDTTRRDFQCGDSVAVIFDKWGMPIKEIGPVRVTCVSVEQSMMDHCATSVTIEGITLERLKARLNKPPIKKVIFNPPATIVFWEDGDKTVVKCQDEPFDKEKGLAMAISRKALGNTYDYYNVFKKYMKEK